MKSSDKNWTWIYTVMMRNRIDSLLDSIKRNTHLEETMENAIKHYFEYGDEEREAYLVYVKDGKPEFPYTIKEGMRILKLEKL